MISLIHDFLSFYIVFHSSKFDPFICGLSSLITHPHQIPSIKFDPLICVRRHAVSVM